MEEEKEAFYVVRKGDVIAIYKSLNDCQAQVGSSVLNPSVSVFKGYCLPKETERHLASHGLKNAIYSISAGNVTEDLFGQLLPCPFEQPRPSIGFTADPGSPSKRLKDTLEAEDLEFAASDSLRTNVPKQFNSKTDFKVTVPASLSTNFQKQFNSNEGSVARATSSVCLSCVLEFDGASKGNPGPAGAGAFLHSDDERRVCKLQEGVGIATNNVAEYRALILGLRHALEEGFKHIRVVGDSKLVCLQIQGIWKIKNQDVANLCKDATELKDKFLSFQINHISRELNCRADDLANLAVNLKDGKVVQNCKIN